MKIISCVLWVYKRREYISRCLWRILKIISLPLLEQVASCDEFSYQFVGFLKEHRLSLFSSVEMREKINWTNEYLILNRRIARSLCLGSRGIPCTCDIDLEKTELFRCFYNGFYFLKTTIIAHVKSGVIFTLWRGPLARCISMLLDLTICNHFSPYSLLPTINILI